MSMRSRIAVIIAVLITVVGMMSLFIVDEREKASHLLRRPLTDLWIITTASYCCVSRNAGSQRSHGNVPTR